MSQEGERATGIRAIPPFAERAKGWRTQGIGQAKDEPEVVRCAALAEDDGGLFKRGRGCAWLPSGGGEVGGEGLLHLGGELGALAGQVEDVDGGFAFGVDEGDFDVALVGAESEGDLAQQAGHILGHHLQQRGVGDGFGVELRGAWPLRP